LRLKLLTINSMKRAISLIVLVSMLLVSVACEKQDVPDNNNIINPNPDPAQYGTPFQGVPDARDVVIYQVNMRAFSNTRNFQGVITRLDSIKALGANVIYLMPIYPVGELRAFNSPYCIKDYKAVNPEFGTLADLRALIDGAHERGMSVILDWVANHTAWDHEWMSNPTWYAKNGSGEMYSPNGWNDVVQLNFSNSEMREEMIRAMKFWVLTANCDGFRCDYSDGPPLDFWKQAIDTLRNIQTHKLLLLAEGTKTGTFSQGFDYTFGFRFYDQMKKVYANNQAATTIDNINTTEYSDAGDNQRVVRYITNHDVNSSDGTPIDLFGGMEGSMAAFVVAAYMKGVPMIYTGQEVGTPYRISFPFTGNTINWTLNPSMTAEYKKIIAFRNSSAAIRRGTLTSHSTQDVCAFTKVSGTETVFVAVNVRNSTSTYTLPVGVSNSAWNNAFTGTQVTTDAEISLEPYEYYVLTK
jgi:glycosidase